MNLNDNPRAGIFCLTDAAVIVDASAKADLEITPTNMTYVIDGLMYSVASGDGDVKLDSVDAHTIADGYSRCYLACVVAAGTITVEVSDPVLNTDLVAGKPIPWPAPTDDSCPFCSILITNSTGSVFTAGTTTLDTTSIFCDIADLFAIPPQPLAAKATTQQT